MPRTLHLSIPCLVCQSGTTLPKLGLHSATHACCSNSKTEIDPLVTCRGYPAVWGLNLEPTRNIYYLVGTVSAICWDGQSKYITPELTHDYNQTLTNGTVVNCSDASSPDLDRIDRYKNLQQYPIYGNGSWQYRYFSKRFNIPCSSLQYVIALHRIHASRCS